MNAEELKRAYQREYQRRYRLKNREKLNQQAKEYRQANPDKVKLAQENYWKRRAERLSNV